MNASNSVFRLILGAVIAAGVVFSVGCLSGVNAEDLDLECFKAYRAKMAEKQPEEAMKLARQCNATTHESILLMRVKLKQTEYLTDAELQMIYERYNNNAYYGPYIKEAMKAHAEKHPTSVAVKTVDEACLDKVRFQNSINQINKAMIIARQCDANTYEAALRELLLQNRTSYMTNEELKFLTDKYGKQAYYATALTRANKDRAYRIESERVREYNAQVMAERKRLDQKMKDDIAASKNNYGRSALEGASRVGTSGSSGGFRAPSESQQRYDKAVQHAADMEKRRVENEQWRRDALRIQRGY